MTPFFESPRLPKRSYKSWNTVLATLGLQYSRQIIIKIYDSNRTWYMCTFMPQIPTSSRRRTAVAVCTCSRKVVLYSKTDEMHSTQIITVAAITKLRKLKVLIPNLLVNVKSEAPIQLVCISSQSIDQLAICHRILVLMQLRYQH